MTALTVKLALLLTLAVLPARSGNCPGGPASTDKLRVHVAMHTHDDVGWDETYMQYYLGNGPIGGRNVSQILTNIVRGLAADPKRRASYVEQAFFQLWYETQSLDVQATVRTLVASKQLVFLNGGWSMHDEAAPTYIDMLDNTAVGQRAIVTNFGIEALPTVTWQIDPFGHSAFQGVLGGPAGGYIGLLWGREAADFKAYSCARKGVERVWLPSATSGGASATLQAVFVDSGYQSPFEVNRCDYGAHDDTCNGSWGAKDVASLISDIDTFRAPNVRGKSILLNLGDDFTAENAVLGTGQGDYMAYLDSVIAALNADASGRFTAFYSTAADYLAEELATVPTFPKITGDFFPYNDDSAGHNMWAGYFTSRPSFKGFVRESSSYMQSARQLQALVGSAADLSPANSLFKLERALGVTQHHDSVAGTARQEVNDDYSLLLEDGRAAAYAGLAADFATATGYSAAPFALCALANVTLCPALEAGLPVVVLVYNALGQAQAGAPVRLSAGFPAGVASYSVSDSKGAAVTAQLVPLSKRDADLRKLYGGSAVATQWLCFTGDLPAAGFAAFFLVPHATAAAAPHTHASVVEPLRAGAGDQTITNGRITLTVASATGFLSSFADATTGVSTPLAQSWESYVGFDGKSQLNGSSQSSGAYIFRPASSTPTPLAAGAAVVSVVSGPVVSEFWSDYAYVTQATRVWAGHAHAEVEWTVGPVDVSDGQSHEVITRYDSGLATSGVWTTDSNCRESQVRQRGVRANWPTYAPSEPVTANYFPVNCLIKTTSLGPNNVTVAVAVDRSEGSTSLSNGQLELMVHRRMMHDDGRGVGQNLNEPGLDGSGLIIRGTHWLTVAPAAETHRYKTLQQLGLALPTTVRAFAPLGALTPAQWLAANTATASLLSAPLPANVHLATTHAHSKGTLLLRLAHLYEAGEDAALSANVTVALATLFAGRTVASAVDMTLPGTQPLAGVRQVTYRTDDGDAFVAPVVPAPAAGAGLSVTLGPMDIRTLMVTFA